MSFPSSTHHSYTTDSEGLRRCSVETNATSTSDFLAAVATEPPRIEDYKGYLAQSVHWPLPQCRAIGEPSDELPSPENLVEASRMPVRDAHGNQLTFRDLYMDGNHVGERRLILFIRHWYCRGCQEYIGCLRDLVASANADVNAEPPPKIILVGIGHHSLIDAYAQRTQCPFPIYTEPSLRLLRTLGCHRWGGLTYRFGKRPEHTHYNIPEMAFHSLYDRYRSVFTDSLGGSDVSCGSSIASGGSSCTSEAGLKKRPSLDYLRAGPISQVGGEFLFENGQLVWCHRMKGMRTHTELKTLRKILKIDDDASLIEARIESKWIDEELREREAQGREPSKALQQKAEKLCKACDASPTAREALAKPISDEEEDRYLERQLGRKPSMASIKNGLRVVREADGRAHLTREMPKVQRKSGTQSYGDRDVL